MIELRGISRLLLLSFTALTVGWLSIDTYLPRANPDLAFGAEHPDTTFSVASRELIGQKGKLDDATYARVSEAFSRDPLASEPFTLFGFRALGTGNLPAALQLLEEARNRNPRNRFSRIALMGIYLRSGRVREGSEEVAALNRLIPGAAEVLVPELVQIAKVPAFRSALLEAIGDEPIMNNVLERLVRDNADPGIILALSAHQPQRGAGEVVQWQVLLLKQLVERGDVSRAYVLWRSFSNANPSELIYDADATGLPGPPPFNWEFAANEIGASEGARGGGLDIEYFGRRSGVLAQQLLMLRPGRYRLQFQAEGNASGQGARIVASVGCRDAENFLVEVPLQGLSYSSARSGTSDFVVPAGCTAQWLRFSGQAADFPNTQRARITGLTLRPAN